MSLQTGINVKPSSDKITKYMVMVLVAGLLGWGLDGMDGNIYALVIQPAMRELLGPTATAAAIGKYAGINVTLYLLGWATGGIVLGMLADKFGRVKLLTVSILMYSVFTGLTGLATEWWHIGICRFLTGLGSGVEWPIGAALIAETWGHSKYRVRAATIMMSGFAIGFFLASLIYRFFGDLGWRPMFYIGILPALTVFFIRKHLEEPDEFLKVKAKKESIKAEGAVSKEDQLFMENPIVAMFRRKYIRHTIVAITMSSAALIGFWSFSTWLASIVKEVLTTHGVPATEFVALISYASMAFNAGGFFGYVSWGFITDHIGRKATFAIDLVGAIIVTPYALLFDHSYPVLLVTFALVGFFTMGFFGGCAVYIPELYPARMRTTACALTNNVARFLTAGGPFISGMLVAPFGSFSRAVAVMSSVYVLGIIALFFAKETRGAELPTD